MQGVKLLSDSFLLHVVVQENVIWIVQALRHQVGVRREGLEAQEHERAQQGGAVGAGLQHADDAVLTGEPLLGEVQHEHEALLAARLQHAGHAQVDGVALHHSFPASDGGLSKIDFELNLHGTPLFEL